jgi:heme exporter protein C
MSERLLRTPREAKLPASALGPSSGAGPVFSGHRLLDRRLSAALGCLALTSLVVLAVLGLWVAPPDAVQGDAQRLMYLHVPTAWLAYLAFGVTALSSALWLWPRTRSGVWDRMAGASAELGVVFTGLTLVLGSLWGRPVWGIWWAWDARLVTTAVLFFLYLGYLALRRIPGPGRERRCAIAALVAFVDVPVVHFSVEWWRTLHQEATVFNPELSADIHGSMAVTLWWGVFAFTVLYVYLLDRRYRLEILAEDRDRRELEAAIAQRLSEAETAGRGGVEVGTAP